jgi:hypothetical protein
MIATEVTAPNFGEGVLQVGFGGLPIEITNVDFHDLFLFSLWGFR